MPHGARELGVDVRMQNRIEALPFERADTRLLVEEETQLGDEADVRESDVASHQELPTGSQRLVDSGDVDRERVTSPCVRLGRGAPAHQGEQIDLRIAREHEARVEE